MTQRIFVVLACAALVGCSDGMKRYPIEGAVTYQGKPVPAGSITFEPDVSVGKVAPTSYAKIENGQFQTPRNEGPVAGKYLIRVSGFDTSKMKMDAPRGEPVETVELFPRYETTVDIPPPDGRLDIQVPKAPPK